MKDALTAQVLGQCVQDVLNESGASDRYDVSRAALTKAILELRQVTGPG